MRVETFAEDLAIALASLRDEKGLVMPVKLSPDYEEHLRLCLAVARDLHDRGYRKTTVVRWAV